MKNSTLTLVFALGGLVGLILGGYLRTHTVYGPTISACAFIGIAVLAIHQTLKWKDWL